MKKTISNLLKDAREHKGYTQKDIADILCYSPQTLSLWESDKVDIKLDSVFAFCDALKIDVFKFLKFEIEDIDYKQNFNYKFVIRYLVNRIELYSISKLELEKVLNVSRPTLRKIMKGEVPLSFNQYLDLCKRLNIDTSIPLEYKGEILETEQKHKRNIVGFSIASASIVVVCVASISLSLTLGKRNNKPTDTSEDIYKVEGSEETQQGGQSGGSGGNMSQDGGSLDSTSTSNSTSNSGSTKDEDCNSTKKLIRIKFEK